MSRDVKLFGILAVALLAVHYAAGFTLVLWPGHAFERLVDFVNFGHERNLPTVFSSVLLSWAGFRAFALRDRCPRDRLLLLILCGVLQFIALDELLEIHERLIPVFWAFGKRWPFLYFSWVVPYSVLTVLTVGLTFPLWRRLEVHTMVCLIAAAVVYAGGALGMEMVQGYCQARFGDHSLSWKIAYTIEESLEVAGMWLCLLSMHIYDVRMPAAPAADPVPA